MLCIRNPNCSPERASHYRALLDELSVLPILIALTVTPSLRFGVAIRDAGFAIEVRRRRRSATVTLAFAPSRSAAATSWRRVRGGGAFLPVGSWRVRFCTFFGPPFVKL